MGDTSPVVGPSKGMSAQPIKITLNDPTAKVKLQVGEPERHFHNLYVIHERLGRFVGFICLL